MTDATTALTSLSVLAKGLEALPELADVAVSQFGEVRLLLEPEVARFAAERATDAELNAIQDALEHRQSRVTAGEDPRWLDIGFHRLVADAAHNPVYAVIMHALMDLEAHVVMPAIVLSAGDNEQVRAAHARVLEAIVSRDGNRAHAAMRAHIVDVQRRMEEIEARSR